MKKNLVFAFILAHIISFAQINLIQNGGFEDVCNNASCNGTFTENDYPDACCYMPCLPDNGLYTAYWENAGQTFITSDPNVFDRRWKYYSGTINCATNSSEKLGVPENFIGTQEHRGGMNAGLRYVGLKANTFRSDGIAAELTQELVKGRDYRLKFYAVKKGGANKDHKIQIQFRF